MMPAVMAMLYYFFILLPSLLNATLYFTTERPVVTLLNPKYVSFFNITAQRFGRRNPQYYLDIYFYESVQNQFRRSLLEMHFKWCNLFLKDAFFGTALRKTLPGKCPHPIGSYHLYNLTINAEAIPESFPFTKGRLLFNVSYYHDPAFSGYSDLELKILKQKRV